MSKATIGQPEGGKNGMWFTLAVLSALLFGLAGLFMKVSQMRGGSHNHLLFGLYLTGSAAFLANSAWERTLNLIDGRLWLAGLIVGMGTAWGNYAFMKALDHGPASLTSPLTNLNIVIIVIFSVTVYGETVGWTQLAGIASLLAAVVLVTVRLNEPFTITEKRWFFYIAAAVALFTFRNGGLKVTEELELPDTPILLIAYMLSLAWFGLALARKEPERNRETGPAAARQTPAGATTDGQPAAASTAASTAVSASADSSAVSPARTGLFWGLVAGVFSYAGLKLYALSIGLGPANIVAPIFATNSLVVAVGSIALYREKLGARQIAAFCLLFAGLILTRI